VRPEAADGQIRKLLAEENSVLALFSFFAAVVVFLVSYRVYGWNGDTDGIVAESRTAAIILLFLLIIQSIYCVLVVTGRFKTPATVGVHIVLMDEDTYFIAFAAVASSCVYIISELGLVSKIVSVSAETESAILAVLLVIQLAYVRISEKLESRK
jgi:hypothetical protein